MTTAALVLAAVVALLSVPTVAALTAWGIAGGDGEPRNALLGVLALCVLLGSLYNAATSFHAFGDLAAWRWWLMWIPAGAGFLGITLSLRDEADRSPLSLLLAVAVPVALAAPAVLVLVAGAVESASADRAAATPSPDPGPAPSASRPAVVEPTAGPEDVLVVNPARAVRQVSAARAQRIRSGGLPGWRLVDTVAQVGQDPRAVAFVPLRQVRPWVRAVIVAGDDPLSGTTTVRVVGDIMLDRGVAAASPPDDPVWTLRSVRGLLTGADLTVGNLESALSENGTPQQPGDDSFAASPAVLDGLADLGIDALSLANNHTGDYGQTALLETLAAVRRSPVVGFGAGRDLADASRPVVLDADGLKVGLVGFNAIGETAQATAVSPGALTVRMPPRTGPLDAADLRHLLGVVRRLDRRADVVVVVPHWGGNYTHVADPAQTQVARRLAAAGADLVAGGHPHWVQGLERVGDAVVAHSLGNLVFDMDFMEETMEGVALTARFAADRLVAVELTPYRLDGSFRPRVVSGAGAAGVLEDVRAHSRGAFSVP